MIWHGFVWFWECFGKVWHDWVWFGMIGHGLALIGMAIFWFGMILHGLAWLSMAWHCFTWFVCVFFHGLIQLYITC
jgi:hypothetical protein